MPIWSLVPCASRISNESTAVITERLKWLAGLTTSGIEKVYLNSVVMRIPSYDGDFEEPWYWEHYGRDLYEFSFYSSRFQALHDSADLARANKYRAAVPAGAVQQFLWRRARNFNITKLAFSLQASTRFASALYVTQDDSGQYGLNVDEAAALREKKKSLSEEHKTRMQEDYMSKSAVVKREYCARTP